MSKGNIKDAWEKFTKELDDDLHDLWVTKYDTGFSDSLNVVREGLLQTGVLNTKKLYRLTLSKKGNILITVDFVTAELQLELPIRLSKYDLNNYDEINIKQIVR